MTTKRQGFITSGVLAGALLLGTAGLAAAQDPTGSPAPNPMWTGPGAGQMGAGMVGQMGTMGAGMVGQMGTMGAGMVGQMGTMGAGMVGQMGTMGTMGADGACDDAEMAAMHAQHHPTN